VVIDKEKEGLMTFKHHTALFACFIFPPRPAQAAPMAQTIKVTPYPPGFWVAVGILGDWKRMIRGRWVGIDIEAKGGWAKR